MLIHSEDISHALGTEVEAEPPVHLRESVYALPLRSLLEHPPGGKQRRSSVVEIPPADSGELGQLVLSYKLNERRIGAEVADYCPPCPELSFGVDGVFGEGYPFGFTT